MTPVLRYFCISLCLFMTQLVFSQVKIGENPQDINEFSLLELESETQTLVISRLSNEQLLTVTPLAGAIVYNTDENCVFFYDGTVWNNLCNSSLIDNGDPSTPGGSETTVGVSVVNNNDGTFTVVTEDGETFTINTNSHEAHSGAEGGVFFGNTDGGAPINDGERFYWNNETKRLGIGNMNPRTPLDVIGVITSGRIQNGFGTASYPAYHFQGNASTGMFLPQRNQLAFSAGGREALRIDQDGNVGVQVEVPLATLHVGGNLRVDGVIITAGGKTAKASAQAIRRLSSYKEALTLSDETLIIGETVEQITLPYANEQSVGILYVLKNIGSTIVQLNVSFKNLQNQDVSYVSEHSVIWLQSDGVEWQQIR